MMESGQIMSPRREFWHFTSPDIIAAISIDQSQAELGTRLWMLASNQLCVCFRIDLVAVNLSSYAQIDRHHTF